MVLTPPDLRPWGLPPRASAAPASWLRSSRFPAAGTAPPPTAFSASSASPHHTYAVDGTPADCVRIAFHDFETPLDWVLAGINRGGNLGVDVYYSGTVAAVREAALRGVPGIAVSHYHNRPLSDQDWERAVEWTTPILERLTAKPPKPGSFWNVNLPSDPAGPAGSTGNARPEVIFCPLDPSPLPLSFESGENGDRRYNGKYVHRRRQSGADVDVCFRGAISVTEISIMEPSR